VNRRVVITGIAGTTSLGDSWARIRENIEAGRGGVVFMHDWARYADMHTRLGAPVSEFAPPAHFNRKVKRTMGRVALMAVATAERAVEAAGLAGSEVLTDGRTGVAYGSSTGSTDALREFAGMLLNDTIEGLNSTSYLRMMSHTAPVNIAIYFGTKGRVITTSSACTSGSQGIGYAYEAIRFGRQEVMIAGGAEELCPSEAAVFDTLFATSTRNDAPSTTPRPFDRDRDGLVVGEGACTFVLESLEHAQARGANIVAEIVGFGTNCDGEHATRPNQVTMRKAMELALADAQLEPSRVGYVNAHGTATEHGDIAESCATAELFGRPVPVSSLKGHFGHTMGACGAIETWLTIEMMNGDWYAPTLNLENVDERCGALDYLRGAGRSFESEYVMNNNFAFGGINTSLVLKRWRG
jgi:3-oxoacyl-[acyl-carrier-protein] synthase II